MGDVVAAVEGDVALVIAVLRVANQQDGRQRGRVESIVQATEILSPEAVQSVAARSRTFDFFERSSVWDAAPERFRLHGVAAQRAGERLAAEAGYETAFCGKVPGVPVTRPGDDPRSIARVGEDYLELLPGRGRTTLAEVLRLKWARRFGDGLR